MSTRRFEVKAARSLPGGAQKWVPVGVLFVNDDGTGAFYPNWLPDTTYRIFEEKPSKKVKP